MKAKLNELDDLKGKNPFKVPDGYIEEIGKQIMVAIPEESFKATKVISLRDRVRPWMYLAAAFAGLLIILQIFIKPVSRDIDQPDNASVLQAFVSDELLQIISDDDLEYLEFIENQYLDREFAEAFDNLAYR